MSIWDLQIGSDREVAQRMRRKVRSRPNISSNMTKRSTKIKKRKSSKQGKRSLVFLRSQEIIGNHSSRQEMTHQTGCTTQRQTMSRGCQTSWVQVRMRVSRTLRASSFSIMRMRRGTTRTRPWTRRCLKGQLITGIDSY